MEQKIYNWYEWHWHKNPATEEESKDIFTKLIENIKKNAQKEQIGSSNLSL